MSILCDEQAQVIRAQSVCSVEDSEDLLQALDEKSWPVDISELTHLHTACLQVLLLRKAKVVGSSPVQALQNLLAQSLPASMET